MLGLAEAGQVRVDDRGRGAVVPEIDLDLAEVLALFEHVGGVGVAQGMDMSGLGDPSGFEGQAEGALEGGAAHGLGGGEGFLVAVAFAGEQQGGMTMRFPLLAQELERAVGQRNIAVLVALAAADVQEHAFGIDIPDLEAQAFPQTQAAGVDGGEADAVVQFGHGGENAAHLAGRENDRELELGIGPGQVHFGGPGAAQRFFPEDFKGADRLGAGLAGDLLVLLEVNAILAELFGGDLVGSFAVVLTELADAGVVGLFGAGADGQELQIIGKGF
jgi:hypothetical protein